jgi:hypothetical protein
MAEFPPRWFRKLGSWFGRNIRNGAIPAGLLIVIIVVVILI